MAAPLNKPKDYLLPKDVKQTELLPPSCFQAPTKEDPWKSLAETTKEVMQLKLENQKLRVAKPIRIPPGEEIHARVDVHQTQQSTYRALDLRAYEDIISRQAAEIGELKLRHREAESQLNQKIAELTGELNAAESQYNNRLTLLNTRLRNTEKDHQMKASQMDLNHKAEFAAERELSDRLKWELEKAKNTYQHQVAAQGEELQKIRAEKANKELQLREEIGSSTAQIDQLQTELAKMKVYMGEVQEQSASEQTWKQEKEDMQRHLENIEEEKAGLESSINLLNIRLTSVNEILTIHEKELSRSKEDLTVGENKKKILLTRWREQVYALLVQRKSAELVHKKEQQNWMQKVALLEANLESEKNQNSVLQHALSDRTAELDMQRNNNKLLQNELTRTQQVALALDDQQQADSETLHKLWEFVKCMIEKYSVTEENFQKVLGSLKAYDQRLSFATGRLEMLQGQFARKEARLKMQLSGSDITIDKAAEVDDNLSEKDKTLLEQMKEELDRVMCERDRLAGQVRDDAMCLQDKVTAVKQQCADQIHSLERKVEELTNLTEEKSQKCRQLSEQQELTQTQAEEYAEEVEQLKLQIARQKMAAEKVLDERRSADLNNFQEQMAAMERKINDARREQTKAVVSLRQLERQTAREKERASEHVQSLEEFYKQEIAKLQHKLQTVETERNLYMSTLRQEGLLGKVRADRVLPSSQNDVDEVEAPVQGPSCDADLDERTMAKVPVYRTGAASEPLTAVLCELQDLTAAVLEDDDILPLTVIEDKTLPVHKDPELSEHENIS